MIKDVVKSKVQYLEIQMEKRFGNNFKYDEHFLPRRWRPTDDIDKIFTAAKAKGEELLDLFSLLRLKPEHDHLSIWNKDKTGPNENPIDENLIILSYDETQKLLDRYIKDTDQMYSQAKHEQESVVSRTSIPPFVIILILILGFDEFTAVLTSPLLLIFWCFVGVLIYILYLLNLMDFITTTFNQFLSQGLVVAKNQVFKQVTSQILQRAQQPATQEKKEN